MIFLALLSLLLGGILCVNAYRTLHSPPPQYDVRYTTGLHRQTAMLVLGLGILLLCLGAGLGVKASVNEWFNPPACGT
jgi:hypothetical protein